jgi:predicted glycosyltransferase
LKDFKPREEVLEGLNLSKDDDIVVVRPEEYQAAYLLDITPDPTPLAAQWIPDLLKEWEGVKIVLLCRYEDQIEAAKRRLGDRVVIPEGSVDGASLLSYARVFIGYGGTMTAEAALLGIPTISSFPGKPYNIERYLVKEGLAVRETDPKAILGLVLNYLEGSIEEAKRRAHRLLRRMENPVDVIAQYIKGLL